MKRGTTEHPKFESLCIRLGLDQWEAIGLLEGIWLFTAKFARRGDIGHWSDEQIARGIGWRRNAQSEMIQALLAEKWLDASADHRLVVHDWSTHCDDSIHVALARAAEVFADGTLPKLARLTDGERKRIIKKFRAHGVRFYAHNGARKAQDLTCPDLTKEESLFARVWELYPRRAGSNPRGPAFQAWRARRRDGVSAEELESAVERYSKFCQATGKIGTETVQQTASFFGPKKAGWKETWELPKAPPPPMRKADGTRKLRLTDGRIVELSAAQQRRVKWYDNSDALPIYEMPNGEIGVKVGASWL